MGFKSHTLLFFDPFGLLYWDENGITCKFLRENWGNEVLFVLIQKKLILLLKMIIRILCGYGFQHMSKSALKMS